MPTGWMIGSLVIKGSMLITLVSFLLAFLIIFLFQPLKKEKLKGALDLNGNALFIFLLGLWMGKILIHFPLFLEDPIAVLAYPSDSFAFYWAFLFFIIYLFIPKKETIPHRIETIYISVFLYSLASIFYYFLPVILGGELINIASFLFFIFLVIVMLSFDKRLTKQSLITLALMIFGIGNILLTIYTSHTLFGYSLSVWFYSLFLVLAISTFMSKKLHR
ncbi:hypothetical protein [Saliterribacillus persicus]|uniref:Uncharacterized protein n=1 Tax=Saliterribacillus persicus TaxID=930114 RepID=A0A368XVG0_9BACI|nr:hypothetical protein [Saliterribacillus persicus]RCW71971.1 hypothetical protein DFR57_105156 [Saliterribacillus persicus]